MDMRLFFFEDLIRVGSNAPFNAGSQEARKSRRAEGISFFGFDPLFLTSDLPIFAGLGLEDPLLAA
jgi:hypothetical protein